MDSWNSILQRILHMADVLSAYMTKADLAIRRRAAAALSAIAMTTVLLVSGEVPMGEMNGLVAFAETQTPDGEKSALKNTNDAVSEETDDTNEDPATNIDQTAKNQAQEETAQLTAAAEAADEEEPALGIVPVEGLEEEPGAKTDAVPTVKAASYNGTGSGQTGKKTGTAESSTEEQDGEAEAESGNSAAEDEQGAEEEPAEEIESEPEAAEAFSSYSPEDYRVLLRIVQAEAGGCDIKGKILVANVILNRVASEEFPDTITEVVYEKRQFSPVSDGSINRCQVAEETVEAVDRALSGEDYSQGALYFMNRSASSGSNVRWFDNHLDFLFRHGSHEFFK